MRKSIVLLCLAFIYSLSASAQVITEKDSIANDSVTANHFSYRPLILPAVLIGYGFIGMESGQVKDWNLQIREEVTENIDEKITIDDFTRWVPAASVYALRGMGIKGKNSLKDQTVILATSYLIMGGAVMGLKSITKVERPDGTDFNSFPSGHTATAFAGAEFLWQEYKDKSIWYGIAGYTVATGTGLFRIYNNRHWLTDVAAGAGIGILSTKIAYWMHPWINRTVFGSGQGKSASLVAPSYNGKQFGVCFVRVF